jgi:hypothetical protein
MVPLVAACGFSRARQKRQPAAPEGRKKSMVSLELRYHAAQRRLQAVLHNGLDHAIRFVAGDLQPSSLDLNSAAGAMAQVEDQRRTRKFDNTVREFSFQEVAAGAEFALGEGAFVAGGKGGYSITWGPFAFAGIAAGNWDATVSFQSSIDRWYDETSRREIPTKGVWTGSLRSNSVSITLT